MLNELVKLFFIRNEAIYSSSQLGEKNSPKHNKQRCTYRIFYRSVKQDRNDWMKSNKLICMTKKKFNMYLSKIWKTCNCYTCYRNHI